jgi:uncharacterized protein (DUF952 family)
MFHLVIDADVRWDADERYAPPSLASEGFIHASFQPSLRESARLYFPGVLETALAVLRVDPRRLDVPVEVVSTPRGPMPHIRGSIPRQAVDVIGLAAVDAHPDVISEE